MPSRIQKSIVNAKVNAIFYVITAILAFFSRKCFLDNLGMEFLGLSGTLGDILNLMNITEMGIGTAVAVTLYKPIFGNDQIKINDIVSVFGYLYALVGGLIATTGVILSCFFPFFFEDIELPLFLAYFMFYAMLYSALLGYFVNYREILLSASQLEYVVVWRYQITMIVKIVLQMLTSFLPYNYLWWIGLEIVTITIYSIILNNKINRYYPWLDTSIKRGKVKFKEYKNLWKMTKQVFVLKISYRISSNTTNLFIYSFADLSMVALYGNYITIVYKVTNLFNSLFTGMGASVGNLIAEGNKQKTLKVFFELLSIRYFIAGLCSIVLYFITSPLISLWLGEEYILPQVIIVLLSIHVFFEQSRITVDNFKNGYGIYQDIWAPILEVIVNIGLSIILGRSFGLKGILMGLILSEFLFKILWRPYYLFKKGFEVSVWKHYCPVMVKYLFIFLICILIISYFEKFYLYNYTIDGWTDVLLYCIIMGINVLTFLSLLFLFIDRHFLFFVRHLLSYFKKS